MTIKAFPHERLVFSGHDLGLEISQSSTCVGAYTLCPGPAGTPRPPAQIILATLEKLPAN